MEIVKKHILSVICGVIALVALVLAFWPLGSMKETAQTELDKRASRYQQLQTLRTKQRHLPVLDISTSEAPLLPGFPSDSAIKKAEQLAEKLRSEKNAVIAAAEAMNQREPLVPQSLPNAVQNTAFEFKERYLKTIAAFPKFMAGGQPPVAADIDAAKVSLWETQYKPKIIVQNGVLDPISEADQKKAFDRAVLDLPEKEKYQRAEQIKVYLGPEAIQASSGITTAGGQAPSRKSIWYAQLTLWVQTDIANAIATANAKAASVVSAPVKQWISLRVDPYRREGAAVAAGGGMGGMGGFGGFPGGPGGFGAPPAPAAAATPGSTGALKFDLSPTGRVCNPLYDVVPFNLVVDVQATQVAAFLQELGRNRLIATTSVNMVPLNGNIMLASPNNFVYGPDPVVRVTIAAESLYLRSWTEKLMPEEVKVNDLGISASAAAGTPGL